MLRTDYENKVINSKNVSILEISPGWYLASNDLELPGLNYEGDDFTKTSLKITPNLEEAVIFQLNHKKDRQFQFAKIIADNIDTCSFKKILIKLSPQIFR